MEDVRRLPVGEEDEVALTLDDLAREGARRMIAAALEAEVALQTIPGWNSRRRLHAVTPIVPSLR